MGGQIVDATIVAAPKQRNTRTRSRRSRKAASPTTGRTSRPSCAQKDRDARWTIKYTKAKPREDGTQPVDLAIPAFGYKNHVSHRPRARPDPQLDGDRRRRSRRRAAGRRARRDEHGERRVGRHRLSLGEERGDAEARGLVSRIHRKKPHGKPMPERTRRANAMKSKVRAAVEHVFAHEKGPMGARGENHRPGAGEGEDRPGQPRLQHAPQVWLRSKTAVA